MSVHTVKIEQGLNQPIIIETGKMALLAGGSVTVQQGGTMVLVAACSADPRPGADFFPLQVDYRERFSAAGKFPGGYFKREGRPSEKEILTARMVDRPIRAMFPKGFINEVQIMATLHSADGDHESDVLSILGASAALMVSDIPFSEPVGAVRVGRVKGKFIANPTHAEMVDSDLDLVYAGVSGKVIMIEGCAKEMSETDFRAAMEFADSTIRCQIEAQKELAAKAVKKKLEVTLSKLPEELLAAVRAGFGAAINGACRIHDKTQRYAAIKDICKQANEQLAGKFADTGIGEGEFKRAVEEITEATIRQLILDEGMRSDGRGLEDIRPISCEVGVLPRTHGSALFARGETQSLVCVTLGSEGDAQEMDAITGGQTSKSFILHYNFPNFSVGETGRIMGPGRREIGHGALAERSVAGMIPEDFPYSVRCISDILGSNGSSSMASVCGATLALMDAGVPIKKPVAGVSCGLVTDDKGRKLLLTDILGSEDHYGDMDFKIAGTRDGITGFQLDLKIPGLDIPTMYEAMLRLRAGRTRILDIMAACIAAPRQEMSKYAPKIHSLRINPEKIGALIGPGGKVIKGIIQLSGAQIDVKDDGTVNVFAMNGDSLDLAVREIEAVTAEVEIGKIYRGEVKTVKDFGAFVEILPGQDGLLHISEMADYRVERVEDICNIGDFVTVKVIDIDDRGRVRLSRKAALAEI